LEKYLTRYSHHRWVIEGSDTEHLCAEISPLVRTCLV